MLATSAPTSDTPRPFLLACWVANVRVLPASAADPAREGRRFFCEGQGLKIRSAAIRIPMSLMPGLGFSDPRSLFWRRPQVLLGFPIVLYYALCMRDGSPQAVCSPKSPKLPRQPREMARASSMYTYTYSTHIYICISICIYIYTDISLKCIYAYMYIYIHCMRMSACMLMCNLHIHMYY